MKITHAISRPPLRYFGGKWKLAPWIISYFQPHQTYLEPCAGGLSVLLRKPRSDREIVADLNPIILAFWRNLRDDADSLIKEIEAITPHRNMLKEIISDDFSIRSSANLYWRSQMAFSGVGTRWDTGTSDQRLAVVEKAHTKGFKHLGAAANRLQGISILQQDCFELIDSYLHDRDTLIYFDPPYVHSSRKSKDNRYKNPNQSVPRRQYLVEMSCQQHQRINSVLAQAVCNWAVSGYSTDLYSDLGNPETQTAITSDNLRSTECLWLSDQLRERPKQLNFLDCFAAT
jgi:site-specific DNA-adenine methylase